MDRIMNYKMWEQVDFNNPEHMAKVRGALAHYLFKPHDRANEIGKKITGAIHEFGTTGDFPLTKLIKTIKSYQTQVAYDNQYEQIFDVEDFTGSRASGYDVEDLTDGITFKLIQNGEKVHTYAMSGERSRVYFAYYGAGLGWHQQLFDDEEYWTMEKTARAFRNKAFAFRAAVFYAMIEALPATQNILWQPEPDGVIPGNFGVLASRDAATINAAILAIYQSCDEKGYNMDNINSVEWLVPHPLELTQRINNAMKFNLQQFNESPGQSIYRWRPIPTNMFVDANAQTQYYVALPKEKMIAAYRMDLKSFQDFDITSLLHTETQWMRFGGSIGDIDQLRRCLTA